MVGVTLLKVIKTIPLFIETTEKKKKEWKEITIFLFYIKHIDSFKKAGDHCMSNSRFFFSQ